MPGRGIGEFIKARQADGLPDRDILAEVLRQFPGASTTLNSVRWYRSQGQKDRGRTAGSVGTAPGARAIAGDLPASIPTEMEVDGVVLVPGMRGFYYVGPDVKTFRAMGRGDSVGFNASLYAGGAKVAVVVNAGDGREFLYHFLDEGATEVDAAYPGWDGEPVAARVTPLHAHWLGHVALLPKEMMRDHPGVTCHVSPDQHLAALVDDQLVERRLRRMMVHGSGAAVFLAAGKLMEVPLDGTSLAKAKRSILKSYPNAVILNELPMAEAIRRVP